MHEESLFSAALEKSDPAERQVFLDQACGGDAGLRRRLERLLAADQHPAGILSRGPAAVLDTCGGAPLTAGVMLAGRFMLRERLGAGGMGEVWVADQLEPVQRRVALKVIRPGLDSAGLLARFDQERQALARMDHPNIAKVLDAGSIDPSADCKLQIADTTSENPNPQSAISTGRPYFVMELIKGVPITDYCDAARLSPRERLELFIPVCQAVQHAHQKGVIHRDLKPSNILVGLYDGQPMPKVIDFGVAKATGPRLTEQSVYTEVGALIGTLEYMSPEQAELNNLDVDTRSDVYGLGVVLYELLTGSVPFTREELLGGALTDTLRIIKEVEPPKPSTKLSDSETLPSLAAVRHMEPYGLVAMLRGELDWIVMKALEKDRDRRYETAKDLAQDVQRYLADEPVLACPPSAAYRLRKFLRRYKGRLAITATVFLAVTVMAASIGWAVRDRVARRAEIEQAETARLRDSLNAARTLIAESKLDSAREKLAQARARLGDDGSALGALATEVEAGAAELDRFQEFLDLIDRAHQAETAPSLEHALAAGDSPVSARTPAPPRTVDRRPAAAVPFLLEALQRYGVLDRADWNRALEGGFLERPQWERIRRLAYEELLWLADDLVRRQQDHRSGKKLPPDAAARQALVYLGKAESAHRPTHAFYALRARCRKVLKEGPQAQADSLLADQTPPTIALDHYLRGRAALQAKQSAQGVQAFEAALRLEPTHYWSLMWQGYCLCDLGQRPEDFARAVGVFTGCILKRPDHAHAYLCRANAYLRLGQYGDAVSDYSKGIELGPHDVSGWYYRGLAFQEWGRPKDAVNALADFTQAIELDPNQARAWNNRGVAYSDLGQPSKALADFSRAIELNPTFARALANRAGIYDELGQPDRAFADCSTAIDLDPKEVYAWNNRGILYHERGELDKAVADFSRAIDLDPQCAPAWSNRGRAFNKLGQPEKAVADCSQAIELDPKRVPAWYNRGIAYSKLRQLEKAVSDYSKAIEMDPNFARAWQSRGDAHDRLGQSDRALTDYSRVVELEPKNASSWYNRGVCYSQADRPDKAVADYSKAIDLNPKYARAWNSRGAAYSRLGQWHKAVSDFSQAIALDSNHAGAWNNRAWAYSTLSQPDKAIADYSKALELNPKFANAWSGRGVASGKLGRRDQAVADCSKAVELAPTQARFWQHLGVAHYRAGDWKSAVAALDQSRKLSQGGDGVDRLFLAMAHQKLGNQDEAHMAYEQAIQWLEKNKEALKQDKGQVEELRRIRAEAEEVLDVKNREKGRR